MCGVFYKYSKYGFMYLPDFLGSLYLAFQLYVIELILIIILFWLILNVKNKYAYIDRVLFMFPKIFDIIYENLVGLSNLSCLSSLCLVSRYNWQ